jgi:hypothetical protein
MICSVSSGSFGVGISTPNELLLDDSVALVSGRPGATDSSSGESGSVLGASVRCEAISGPVEVTGSSVVAVSSDAGGVGCELDRDRFFAADALADVESWRVNEEDDWAEVGVGTEGMGGSMAEISALLIRSTSTALG